VSGERVRARTDGRSKFVYYQRMTAVDCPNKKHLLRPMRERIAQTLAFEIGGLALVLPAYAAITGRAIGESAALMIVLALGCLVMGPLHNALYDRIDLHFHGRTACQRHGAARLCHAVSHELALTAVGIPILMGLGGHGVWETLALNFALTLTYTAWAAVFYLAWDRARPLTPRSPVIPRESFPAPSGP
jgi:uncharacterized membrane protein